MTKRIRRRMPRLSRPRGGDVPLRPPLPQVRLSQPSRSGSHGGPADRPGPPVHCRHCPVTDRTSGAAARLAGAGYCRPSRTGLANGGRGYFGQAEASGPDRAVRAAEAALADFKRNIRNGVTQ